VSDFIQDLKTSRADSLPKAEKSIVVLPFDKHANMCEHQKYDW